jgi:hypothetical protein
MLGAGLMGVVLMSVVPVLGCDVHRDPENKVI